MCDISFMAEDALQLDGLARDRGLTAVVDCGVAPGLSNLAVGRGQATLERLLSVAIYVGGLPRARHWPYAYSAPFAPGDVIEEYTRPVRLRRHGRELTVEALGECELLDFEGVGTLEAFVTDGLRSLLATVEAPDMVEKTLRYPGHAELMRVLRHSGFFDQQPVRLGQTEVRPIDLTSHLLTRCWTPQASQAEFTVLRVVVEGERQGRAIRQQTDLFAESQASAQVSSMASTTGTPAAIVARMLLDNSIEQTGVLPPEKLGQHNDLWGFLCSELSALGLNLKVSEQEVQESS
jgi:saccharopine dehydrogenase-like NADP-dependent oxidoreductase